MPRHSMPAWRLTVPCVLVALLVSSASSCHRAGPQATVHVFVLPDLESERTAIITTLQRHEDLYRFVLRESSDKVTENEAYVLFVYGQREAQSKVSVWMSVGKHGGDKEFTLGQTEVSSERRNAVPVLVEGMMSDLFAKMAQLE